jgi:NAD(P)-dependent dehydrogenase (short-subunit alcohol dehydrogenase family)
MAKVALVTGGSSGIGEATARALAANGYTVYAGARRVEKMASLTSAGIVPVALDVTDEMSMREAVGQIIAEAGQIDLLVNNAGYGAHGAVEDVSQEDARRQLDVNLFGLVRMTQLVLPQMRARQRGKIVNITSVGGKLATPFGGWYHASKFAVEGLSDSLRIEVRQFGIDMIVIEPGGIKSEWGGIANDSLLRTSGDTAYGPLARRASRALNGTERRVPGPEVIGDLIVKAVRARRPRARYHAGLLSWIVVARRFIPDGLFDRLVLSQMR